MIFKSSRQGSFFMHVFRSFILLFAISLLVAAQCPAQQPASTKDKDKEAERTRRAKAVDLIVDTAEAARSFKDLFYRARIQALAADVLWPHDQERARDIFRRAWDAATAYDKGEQEVEERESGVPSTLPITEARDEVLAKAASRDSKLAAVFLNDLLSEKKVEEKPAEQSQSANPRRTPWREVSPAGIKRLAVAYALLIRNEPGRAVEIALPVTTEGASGELMTFVLRLREQDSDAADWLYSMLLQKTALDALADANDVLLLSSLIISPQLLVVIDGQGALQFRPVPRARPNASVPPVAPAERGFFYALAASILLRPIVPPAGSNATWEAIALYFTIGRLLPAFEREAAQHVPALRLRSSTLSNDIEARRRETLVSQFDLISLTPDRPGDPMRSQIDQLGRARDALDRDRVALGIVRKAAQLRLWDRARRAAMEIEDIGRRRAALSFIAVSQIKDLLRAFTDDKEENFERLAKFVRNADVPPLASAWGIAQTAAIAARLGKPERAAALLDEAEQRAARTPAGTRQRVGAYIAVARLAVGINARRAWEILPEIVRAANALEDFAGDDVSIDIDMDEASAEGILEPLMVESDIFRLDLIFATMAHLDYEKALTASRALGREVPHAFASLAIARTMLISGIKRPA